MGRQIEAMWASKLGLPSYDAELVNELLELMVLSKADYTIFFRRLSEIPEQLSALKASFYLPSSEKLDGRWESWLQRWRKRITDGGDPQATSEAMKRTNPKITWRERLIAPAYEQAAEGDYSLIQELQAVFSHPYDDQSAERGNLRPPEAPGILQCWWRFPLQLFILSHQHQKKTAAQVFTEGRWDHGRRDGRRLTECPQARRAPLIRLRIRRLRPKAAPMPTRGSGPGTSWVV